MNKLVVFSIIFLMTACDLFQGHFQEDWNEVYILRDSQGISELIRQAGIEVTATINAPLDKDISNLVIASLNAGVDWSILMNVCYSNIRYGSAQMYYGNGSSLNKEDVFIVDHKLTLIPFREDNGCMQKGVVFRSEEVHEWFLHEFGQIAFLNRSGQGNDSEKAKLSSGREQSTAFPGGRVGVKFHPQDGARDHLVQSIEQARSAIRLYSSGVEDGRILYALSLRPESWNSFFDIVQNDSSFTVLYIEEAGPQLLLWNFDSHKPFQSHRTDGFLISFTGKLAERLHHELIGSSFLELTNTRIFPQVSRPAPGSVVFTEVGFINDSGEWGGDFIELYNTSPAMLDLSGCTIIISNANRLSQPGTMSFPLGTLLPPGECLVVASSFAEYRKVDFQADLFLYSRGFSLSLMDTRGVNLDTAGDPGYEFRDWGGRIYTSSRDRSMTRLDPTISGSVTSNWTGTTMQTNLFPSAASLIWATPGYYTP